VEQRYEVKVPATLRLSLFLLSSQRLRGTAATSTYSEPQRQMEMSVQFTLTPLYPWAPKLWYLYGWLGPTAGMDVVKSRKICRRSNPIFSVVQSAAYSRYRLEMFVPCWKGQFLSACYYCRTSHLICYNQGYRCCR
jgi:hypothetical protein